MNKKLSIVLIFLLLLLSATIIGVLTSDAPDTSLPKLPKKSFLIPKKQINHKKIEAPPSANPPDPFLDNNEADPLPDREEAFEEWSKTYALWEEMDAKIKDCVRIKYVNGFGRDPESGLDSCLDYYETKSP